MMQRDLPFDPPHPLTRPVLSDRLPLVALAVLLLGTLALAAGCGSIQDDPVRRLSGEEALEQGKALLEQEKYTKARKYLTHAFEVQPNSLGGREALLLVADSFYLQGGRLNYIDAEAKYRDFLNRFPTSAQAAYAQFQLANSLAKRIERPDRDQSPTLKAYQAYEELMRLYPTSEYAEQASEQVKIVEENLAEHEFVVGNFYYRVGNFPGAIGRFEELLERYPHYSEPDKVLFYLGSAYNQGRTAELKDKARAAFERLRTEHPDSQYVPRIPEISAPDMVVPSAQTAEDGEEGDDDGEGEGDGRDAEGDARSGATNTDSREEP